MKSIWCTGCLLAIAAITIAAVLSPQAHAQYANEYFVLAADSGGGVADADAAVSYETSDLIAPPLSDEASFGSLMLAHMRRPEMEKPRDTFAYTADDYVTEARVEARVQPVRKELPPAKQQSQMQSDPQFVAFLPRRRTVLITTSASGNMNDGCSTCGTSGGRKVTAMTGYGGSGMMAMYEGPGRRAVRVAVAPFRVFRVFGRMRGGGCGAGGCG